VNLTVCTAPTTATVPSVVGDTVATASSALQAVGLAVGTISNIKSCDVRASIIASQTPRAGTVVALGSTVNLVVSSGRPPTPCP
jgi:beta-lactam-binding protein with PASTA domain